MATKTKIDTLDAERRRIMAKIWAREARQRVKANRPCVGKFYRYRNCYSCPQQESDYWWLYYAVTGIDKDGNLKAWSFQDDNAGRLTIEFNRVVLALTDGYREIVRGEFAEAWRDFKSQLLAKKV